MTAKEFQGKKGKWKNANGLTKAIIAYLSYKGHYVWRQNNIPVPLKGGGFRSNSTKKGIPDILGVQKDTGTFIAIEVKAGKDSLSADQRHFLKEASSRGAIAIVARSLDEVMKIL